MYVRDAEPSPCTSYSDTNVKTPAVPPQQLLSDDEVGEFPIYYTQPCYLYVRDAEPSPCTSYSDTNLKTPAVPPQQLLSDDEVGEFPIYYTHTHVCQRCRTITMYIILRY